MYSPHVCDPTRAQRALSLHGPLAILVSAALLVACAPGLVAYFDWPLHLYWVQEFARNVSEGALYPHWIAGANGGYGAPSFVFYGPLAYWLACGATTLTGSALIGLKSVYVAAILVSAYSCRMLFRSSGPAALTLAVAATVSPSLLMLVTHFNLPAAALAASLSPWVIAGVRSAREWSVREVSAIAVPYALVALAHLPSAFMLAIASMLLAATNQGAPSGMRKVSIVVAGILAGLGLCAFYVLPALWELRWVHADALTNGVLDWRGNLLFDPGTPSPPRARGDGPYLELTATALFVLAATAWFWGERFGDHGQKLDARSWSICAFSLLALCTPLAAGFYEFFPGAAFLQFGWRWLPLASIFAWSAVAAALRESSKVWSLPQSLALPAMALFASLPLLFNTGLLMAPAVRASQAQIRWALSGSRIDPPEHRPVTASRTPSALSSAETWTTIYGDAVATPTLQRDEKRAWKTDARTDSVVRIRTLCYPAWRARIDNRDTPVACDRDGILILHVPQGSHVVETVFAMTADHVIGVALSTLAAFSFFVLAWFSNKRGRRLHTGAHRNSDPAYGRTST